MRCNRCGKELITGVYKYNTAYCEDCAKELGLFDPLAMANKMMNLFNDNILNFGELEFSPTKSQIKCPKCGTSLLDYEKTKAVGCIECYNTFNEVIVRDLMRAQASDSYSGRTPGQFPSSQFEAEGIKSGTNVAETDEMPKATEQQADNAGNAEILEKLARFEKADQGMLSDDDLREAIKLAVSTENYMLAAKLRDELKGREDKA